MVLNWSGPMKPTVWPIFSSSLPVVLSVRTTPLICGCHASVMNRILTLWAGSLCGCALAFRVLVQPKLRSVEDFQLPTLMLDQRGAAFDPVAVVAVGDAVDLADVGVVDVAADGAVDMMTASLLGQHGFECTDELDRVLNLVLEIGRQRPIRQVQLAPDRVEPDIDHDLGNIGIVAD